MKKALRRKVAHDTGIMSKHVESSVNMAQREFGIGWLGVGIAERSMYISNNPSFRLKRPGVPDGSDGSDGTLYPLMENYTLPVAPATGRVAYSTPLPCAWYTHHQNDTCVTLFAGPAVML
jgi:hypothetical protein